MRVGQEELHDRLRYHAICAERSGAKKEVELVIQ